MQGKSGTHVGEVRLRLYLVVVYYKVGAPTQLTANCGSPQKASKGLSGCRPGEQVERGFTIALPTE